MNVCNLQYVKKPYPIFTKFCPKIKNGAFLLKFVTFFLGDGEFFVRDVNGGGRGHSLKLFKNIFQIQVGQRFFTNRIVVFWNSLTKEIVSSSSIAI